MNAEQRSPPSCATSSTPRVPCASPKPTTTSSGLASACTDWVIRSGGLAAIALPHAVARHTVPPEKPWATAPRTAPTTTASLATLPESYADGLPALQSSLRPTVCGGALPTPVCMDGACLDGHGPMSNGGPGSKSSGTTPAHRAGPATDTIPYELLCRIPRGASPSPPHLTRPRCASGVTFARGPHRH